MNSVLLGIISDMARISRVMLSEYGNIMMSDKQYTDHSAEITQAEIDTVQTFVDAGLTPADLSAVNYTQKMIKSQMDTIDLDALVKVSKL